MEKIIIFTPCFYNPEDSRSTGGTISNYHLFKELSNDFELTIVTPEASADFDFPIKLHTSEYTKNVYSGSFIARLKKLFRYFWLKKTAKKLSHNDYAFSFFTNGSIISCFKWYSKTNRIILTRAFEDLYKVTGENCFAKKIVFNLLRSKTKKFYKLASSIITNSTFMKDGIVNDFDLDAEKVFVLYPPIHCPNDQGFKFPMVKRIKIGMINPTISKGENIFLKLAENYKAIEFVYFSKNDKEYSLPNIYYKGWASTTESIFSEIDLLLVPSQWEEPFGRVAAEGILFGRPVLVSNRGGLPEIVNENFISDYSNVNSWIEKIDRIILNREFTELAWSDSYAKCQQFRPENHNYIAKNILINSRNNYY